MRSVDRSVVGGGVRAEQTLTVMFHILGVQILTFSYWILSSRAWLTGLKTAAVRGSDVNADPRRSNNKKTGIKNRKKKFKNSGAGKLNER